MHLKSKGRSDSNDCSDGRATTHETELTKLKRGREKSRSAPRHECIPCTNSFRGKNQRCCLSKLEVAAWMIAGVDKEPRRSDKDARWRKRKPRQQGQALIDEHGEQLGPRCSWLPGRLCTVGRQERWRKLSPSRPEFLVQLGTATVGVNESSGNTPHGALCHAVTTVRAWTRSRTQSASSPCQAPLIRSDVGGANLAGTSERKSRWRQLQQSGISNDSSPERSWGMDWIEIR